MARRRNEGEEPFLENHRAEQYFFTEATTAAIGSFLERFDHPCCLCAPMVGKYLSQRGHRVTLLDSDERFAGVPGYRKYDLYRPDWIDERFDVIFCDPPFFNVSLSQLFKALRQLSHHDFAQPVALCYLSRRADAVVSSLHLFGLQPSGKVPEYNTVQQVERNLIEIFANVDVTDLDLYSS